MSESPTSGNDPLPDAPSGPGDAAKPGAQSAPGHVTVPDSSTAAGGNAKPGNVTRLQYHGKEIHLVGTAHISQRSVEEVQRVIAELKPDTVCVELDQTRYDSMVDESRFRKLDIFEIIKQKKVLFLLSSLMLSSFQRRMGERLGVKPGAELLAAVQSAEAVGAELILADRDVQATLKRSWANLTFMNQAELMGIMFGSLFASEEISAEQIEELKDRDTINEMMGEFARQMPRLQIPLIDERDRYLMSTIQEAPGKTIVGVVGAGHVSGMVNYLGTEVDRDALSQIPPPSLFWRVAKWIVPAIILSAFYFGYREHQGEGLKEMLYAWIIPNTVGTALLSAVAGAKPLTVIVAGLASPLTSLNPTIGAGVVAAFVEAWARRPTVEDCEGINDAMLSLKGMYQNQFTRVLLVALAATIGSALGTWIGAGMVLNLLS